MCTPLPLPSGAGASTPALGALPDRGVALCDLEGACASAGVGTANDASALVGARAASGPGGVGVLASCSVHA